MILSLNVVLSALLVYLSFPNLWSIYGFWPLAWVSVIPLIKALEGQSLLRRFGIGFLYGLILYVLLLLWLFPVHVLGASIFVLAMSIQPVLFSVLYSRSVMRTLVDPQNSPSRNLASVIFVPALWAASEWARTMALGGFAWGIAYSQSFQPAFIQLASAAGLYGVSFVLILVNVLTYRFMRAHDLRALAAAVGVVSLLCVSGQWRLSTPESGHPIFTVCAVQPNLTPHMKSSDQDFDDNIRLHVELTVKSVAGQEPDVIVWPETAFPADISKDRFWYPRFGKIASGNNALFVFGAAPVIDGKNYNSAVVLDDSGAFAGVYDKQFLVPVSEFKPGGIFTFLSPAFEGFGFDFSAGGQPGLFSSRDGKIRFGMMICSETCYPSLTRQLSNSQALWMIAILNDGWFARPEAIMMHAQNAVFRAVESGRDFVSVGNTGWTGRIDGYGVMRPDQQLPLERQAQGAFHVSSRQKNTLYSKIGDFFAGACGLFVIMFLIFQPRTRKKS